MRILPFGKPNKSKVVQFGDLEPGRLFIADGATWRVLPRSEHFADLHNAQQLGTRQTRAFDSRDFVQIPQMPKLGGFRRWLITRSLRWEIAGFHWWAKWTWRLARAFASERTNQALAAHASQLLMMGE